MWTLSGILIWLWQRLYPSGRAFLLPPPTEQLTYLTDEDGNTLTDDDGNPLITEDSVTANNGVFYRLHRALSISWGRAYTTARGVQDAQLPDNPNFTIDDAHDWYRRLGIYDSGSVSLSDMMAAIRQRMSFPLVPLDKQSPAFIQAQLRAAGFDVYVYKNRFSDGAGGWVTKTPGEVLGETYGEAEHGIIEHGDTEHGGLTDGVTKCVNYLEEDKDEEFFAYAESPDGYRATFFVAGNPITTFANVPAARQIEFRQLLLKQKAAQMCAFMFVSYS